MTSSCPLRSCLSPRRLELPTRSLSASIAGFKLGCLTDDYLNPFVEERVAFAIAQLNVVGTWRQRKLLEFASPARVAAVNVNRSVLHLGNELDVTGGWGRDVSVRVRRTPRVIGVIPARAPEKGPADDDDRRPPFHDDDAPLC